MASEMSVEKKIELLTEKIDSLSQKTDHLVTKTDDLTRKTDVLATKTDDLTRKTDDLAGKTDDLTRKTDTLTERTDLLSAKMSVGFDEAHRLLKLSLEGLGALRETTDARFDRMSDDHAKQLDLLTRFGVHVRRRVERLESASSRRRR